MAAPPPAPHHPATLQPILTGLDRLLEDQQLLHGKRIALLTHAAAVDRHGVRGVDGLFAVLGTPLRFLLSPEHGLDSRAAAGAHVASGMDLATGLPIHSLYGATREPDAALFADIDAVLVDLQDVGARPFTYSSTLAAVLRVAARTGTEVIILDRPDLVGGTVVEGPVLDPALHSFVGAHPVALRHGMTLGELAMMINAEANIGARLEVLRVTGWRRDDGPAVMVDGRIPFRPPSPNLRAPSAILAYSGMVLFEGTNVSEGRGTPRPFETIGAPWIKSGQLAEAILREAITGVDVDPISFTPATSKYAGEACEGIDLWVADRRGFRAVTMALTLLSTIARLYPRDFAFLAGTPPFFDRLAGQSWLRDAILSAMPVAEMEGRWAAPLAEFMRRRADYLLYT